MKNLKEPSFLDSEDKRYYKISEVVDILNKNGINYYNHFLKTIIQNKIVNYHNINYNSLRDFFIIKTSTLRFWEEHFNVKPKKLNNNNQRKYTIKDIKILETLYHYLKIQGMDINILKMKITLNEIQLKET